MILIDRQWLVDTLATLAWNEREVIVILDSEDRILAQVGSGAVPESLRYRDLVDLATSPMRYGKGFLVSSASSPVLDWKVVSFLPEAVFMRPVTSLQTVALVGLGVCLLAGGLMAFGFSKRNYTRISEVTREMADLAGIRLESGNEFTVLREAVSATLTWKAKLDSDLRQNTAAMRQSFLCRLVRGRFASTSEVEQSFADYGIVPLSPYYAVFIVHPEGLATIPPQEAARKLASFIIANAVEGIIGRSHRGFVAEHDDLFVCVVSLRLLSALEWNNDLDSIIADTRACFAQTFGLKTSVGLSSVLCGIESIPQAFQEALDALEYKLVVGSETVIRYADVGSRRSTYTYRCSLETEQQLYNAVRLGDEEKAEEILDLIAERNLRSGDVSIQGLKCFIFDMYHLLSQAAATVDESRRREQSEIAQPLMRALEGDTSLPALEREIRGVVLEACRSMRGVRKDNRLAISIREFVELNHADLNLSIRMIADHFDMSQGYVSKLFREMTGQGLLDFIAGVRIAHAKQLIATGRRSLEDVAGRVGYTNANALIRAFKKHEGITPGRYRDSGTPADEP